MQLAGAQPQLPPLAAAKGEQAAAAGDCKGGHAAASGRHNLQERRQRQAGRVEVRGQKNPDLTRGCRSEAAPTHTAAQAPAF